MESFLMEEDVIDITDEIAAWKVCDVIKLLQFLDRNGYSKFYFDGNGASIEVFRERKDL